MLLDPAVLPAQTAACGGIHISKLFGFRADNPDVVAQFVQGFGNIAFRQQLTGVRNVGANGNRPFPAALVVKQGHDRAVGVNDRAILAAQRRFTLPHLAALKAGANFKRQRAVGHIVDLENLLAHQLVARIARHFKKLFVRFGQLVLFVHNADHRVTVQCAKPLGHRQRPTRGRAAHVVFDQGQRCQAGQRNCPCNWQHLCADPR